LLNPIRETLRHILKGYQLIPIYFTPEKLRFTVPHKIEDFVGLGELGNRIILKHRLLLVIGGEGGRLRSDRASTAKGFVFVKKPYPTRF
jgi:hypothetical protein